MLKVSTQIYEGCHEISFFDTETGWSLGIILEDDHCWWVYSGNQITPVQSGVFPDEITDMFKEEYRLSRPEVELPPLEEIEPLPWE